MKIVKPDRNFPQGKDSRTGSLEDYEHLASRDLFEKTRRFQEFIVDARNRGHEKYLYSVIRYEGGRALVESRRDGQQREIIMFCSADYLNLAHTQEVLAQAHTAVDRYGSSVSSVPLIAGSTGEHRQLEKGLCEFLGFEDVVLFPTGHAANTSTIAALTDAGDLVLSDRTVHESITEGIQLSNASMRVFKHFDTDSLERALKRIRRPESGKSDQGLLIIVEGVCGLDGDVAPLPEIVDLADRFEAKVMVDDAHAVGVLGEHGRGSVEHHRLRRMPDLHMGSFSKALGSVGGWIGCSKEVADYLRYYARTVVYSVGMSPIHAAIANGSLNVLAHDPQHIRNLNRNADYFRQGLIDLGLTNAAKSSSAIMSVFTNNESNLRSIVADLFDNGVWVEGLPYPAVRKGEERVRFRLRSAHTLRDMDEALETTAQVFRKHGII